MFEGHAAALVEEEALTLKFQVDARTLLYIERFHRTPSTSFFLRRYHVQPRLNQGLAAKLSDLMGPPLPPVQPPHISRLETTVNSEIPGVRKTKILPDAVLRSLVAPHLKEGFLNHLLLFINASVQPMRNSATAAALFPAGGHG